MKFFKSVTSHALGSWTSLVPITNCHTLSDPLPLERDLLYGGQYVTTMASRLS